MNDSGVNVKETQTGLKISFRRNSKFRQVSMDVPPLQLNGVPAKENSNENDMDYEYDESQSDSEHDQNPSISMDLLPRADQQRNEASQNMQEQSDDDDSFIDPDGVADVVPEIKAMKSVIKLPPFAAKAKLKRMPMPKKPIEDKRIGVESIAPNICFPFLYDGCVEMENCYYPHEYPTADEIYERIVRCGPENASKLFHVIVARCPSLLERYFETFVEFFALHVCRIDLAKTIAICERDMNAENKKRKFRFLIKAFLQSGFTYQLTIRTILTALTDVNIAIITLLLDLRIVNGTNLNDLFEVLQALVIDSEFIFKPALGNYLLTICNRHSDMKLVHLVKNLLRPSNRHRMIGVEDHLLRQFHRKFIQHRVLNGQRMNGQRPGLLQTNGPRQQNNRNRAIRGRNVFPQRPSQSN